MALLRTAALALAALAALAAAPATDCRCEDITAVPTFHVSPDGDDDARGTLQSPLRTLEAARDVIRTTRRCSSRCDAAALPSIASMARVYVHHGVHRLAAPLALTAEDSWTEWHGTPHAGSGEVGAAGETAGAAAGDGALLQPVISGGRRLAGEWHPPKLAGSPWKLQITAPTLDADFHQLFVSGKRAIRAREPEIGGYFRMEAALDGADSEQGFVYEGSDLDGLVAALDRPTLPEVVVFTSWQAGRRTIRSVNATSRTLLLEHPTPISIDPYANSGSRYYVENFEAACDSPGEWWLGGHTLLWQPRTPDEDPRTLEFEASVLAGPLVLLNGSSHVAVANLTLQHADWSFREIRGQYANTSSGAVQEASFLGSAALHLANTSHCAIEGVTVQHVGEHGIWTEQGAVHTAIRETLVADTGAGGIRVGRGKPLENTGDGTAFTTITDSTVVFGGQVFPGSGGIMIQKSNNNVVQNCEVAYHHAHGISVGWTWDYRPSEAQHNIVRDCHVHHLGNGVLSDLAGIYLLGRSPGTGAHRNVIHDIYPYYRFGHGVYLDQACSGVVVDYNVAYHTEGAIFYQHYGRNNSIRSNVFAWPTGGVGAVWQHAGSNCECDIPKECGDTVVCGLGRTQGCCSDVSFSDNIVYVDARVGPRLFGSQWTGNSSFSSNLYYNVSALSGALSPSWPSWNRTSARCANASTGAWECSVCNESWAKHQASGQDVKSVVGADPLFVNLAVHNFTLRMSSPARALGFDAAGSAAHGGVGPRSSLHAGWRPSCSASCAVPPAPTNGSLSGAGNDCGDVVVAHCNPGFKLIGSVARTCGEHGWTPAAPTCAPAPRGTAFLPSAAGTYYSNLPSAGFLLAEGKHDAHALQQADGRLCVYLGQPGHATGPPTWCSIPQAHPVGEYHTSMQGDGNLCTATGPAPASNDAENDRQPSVNVWCAGAIQKQQSQFYAAVVAGASSAELCVFRGTMPPARAPPVWCSSNSSLL